MRIALTFPPYNTTYYQRMLFSLSAELRKIGIPADVLSCGSPALAAYPIVFSLNSSRRDHRLLSRSSRFILWLQDCPLSTHIQLSFFSSSILRGDTLLFAAPNGFGFNWKRLLSRGVNIGSLFYGYNQLLDNGLDAIRSKHSIDCGSPNYYLSKRIASFISDIDVEHKNIKIVNKQLTLKQSSSSRPSIPLIDPPLLYPTTLFSGFYDVNYANLLYSPPRRQRFFQYNVWKSFYHLSIFRIYPAFQGALGDLSKFRRARKGVNIILWVWFAFAFNSLTRIIERTSILQSLISLSSLPQFSRHILVQGGLFRNLFASSIPSLDHLEIDDYNEILQASSVTICNNTHGLGLHPRVMDAMISGAVVLHHSSPFVSGDGVLESHFTPGVHYLEWKDSDDLYDLVIKISRGEVDLEPIAASAYHRVREFHSWSVVAKELSQFIV